MTRKIALTVYIHQVVVLLRKPLPLWLSLLSLCEPAWKRISSSLSVCSLRKGSFEGGKSESNVFRVLKSFLEFLGVQTLPFPHIVINLIVCILSLTKTDCSLTWPSIICVLESLRPPGCLLSSRLAEVD